MLTVYIADDEVWITLGLTKLLEKSGYDIWVIGTANNGITAKEEIAEFKPDILFTDIRMPGKTGLELLSEIPEVSPATKVVMISGYAEFSYAQEAVKLHAYDYLLKPIKEEELNRILQDNLIFHNNENSYSCRIEQAVIKDKPRARARDA